MVAVPNFRAHASYNHGVTRAIPSAAQDVSVAATWLHQGSCVGLHSWACGKTNRCPGAEEAQSHHEVAVVLDGMFDYVGPRGRAVADPNTALLLRANEPYRTAHPLGSGDAGFSVVLSDEALLDLTAAGRATRGPLSIPVSPRSHLLLSRLGRRMTSGPVPDELEVEEALLRLVDSIRGDLHRRTDRPVAGSPGARERIAFARALLAAEFDRPQRLADLARRAGLSRAHFCRLFREETGVSVHRYLTRLRLRAALAALASDRADLSDVALAVGFSSHSHFTLAFRREFGTTPSRIRSVGPSIAAPVP